MSSVTRHRDEAPRVLRLALVTISDTRTLVTDTSGQLLAELCQEAGHQIQDRQIVPDGPEVLEPLLKRYAARDDLDAALLTGGTGISPRDLTYETVSGLLTRVLPGYGELFRMLSYAEIGSAAMLSRALGGMIDQLVVLVMPGSRGAVRLAVEKLILPELPHLVREARKTG